jgi:enoyl-CoA hydratase/3-hydroxyacyl-CoA dehydrogenase
MQRDIRTIGVVGAGNMGSGIAQKYAAEGFSVVLVDLDEPAVERGLARIDASLREGVERRVYSSERAAAIRGRIRGTADWGALADVDLALEAVFEDLGVKRDVMIHLEEVTRPDAILATNTSSFMIHQLAGALRRRERLIGLHYFYHPAKNRLVEVVSGPDTSREVFAAAWELQDSAGKTPIRSADAPGFVVNRFFVPWLNEAVRLLESGTADIATIEAAAKKAFGVAMGPFELMNVTGVPIAHHAAETLGRELGALYAPARLLGEQARAGKPWALSGEPNAARFGDVGDELIGVVFAVAAELVTAGVGTIEDVDIGARVGLRWPRGPFEMMNSRGMASSIALAERTVARHDRPLPALLSRRREGEAPFVFRLVRLFVDDGIATLTINRPDALNALSEEVVAQLADRVGEALGRHDARALVLAGTGKAFVAGADIGFFLRHMERGDLERIAAFTARGQELLRALETSAKPVVARLAGLSLGGGSELALAADRIVATDRGSMGFPETGLGIYPGLGGTQRLRARVGKGLARYLIYTGDILGARDALAIGLIDAVVPHTELPEAIREATGLPPRPEPPAGAASPRGDALHEPYRALEAFFLAHGVADLLAGKADAGGNAAVEKAAARVRRKAPIALRLAERLIDEGEGLPWEQALALELRHLREIFSTADAREGLSSLGRRTPPVFKGE